ncbi:hypothetical protein [Mumia sp. Pv 4-285]|uniref:hypothetical protein n=1 Tax=Mumia qirimensis TaxID=3234852 RepID=UPI00351D7C74
MLRRTVLALITALAVVLATPTLLSAPADAAGKRTQTYSGSGLRASLTVDFKPGFEWTLRGWVKDVCDSKGRGDGRGVYMENPDALVKTKKNGWKVVGGWFGQGSDTNGCGNGKVKISKRRMTQTGKTMKFEALRIKVCARKGKNDPAPLCYVRVWYNPYY